MQFLVLGYDGDDESALDRRLTARSEHVALGDVMEAAGNIVSRAAILDDAGKMVGSAIMAEFSDRAELNAWLEREPYVKQNVWKKVDIHEIKIIPRFPGD